MMNVDNLPKSGVAGVVWVRGKWRATIKARGVSRYLGVFDDLNEAIAARAHAVEAAKSDLARPKIAKGERISSFEVEVMRDIMHGLLEADHPQSVRHVFYLMTDPRRAFHVEKTEAGYRQVQRQLSEMRKLGLLPYGWIADATRMGWHVYAYTNAADFIRRMHGAYRADIWGRSDAYCETWVESRSIASVIRDDCDELGVSLYPAGGFSSLTLPYEAAQEIADKVRDTGKTIEIVYVGDYDPAGVLIDVDIEGKIRGHLDNAGIDNPVSFHRIAITPEQIAEHDLPTKPRKEGDKRASTSSAPSKPRRCRRISCANSCTRRSRGSCRRRPSAWRKSPRDMSAKVCCDWRASSRPAACGSRL
jgi:hypothetical protein